MNTMKRLKSRWPRWMCGMGVWLQTTLNTVLNIIWNIRISPRPPVHLPSHSRHSISASMRLVQMIQNCFALIWRKADTILILDHIVGCKWCLADICRRESIAFCLNWTNQIEEHRWDHWAPLEFRLSTRYVIREEVVTEERIFLLLQQEHNEKGNRPAESLHRVWTG